MEPEKTEVKEEKKELDQPKETVETKEESFESFEAFYGAQLPAVKKLMDENLTGLKSALKTERESRKDLEKQVRELAGKAEAGSDFEKQLTEAADKLAANDKRVDFYEAAHAAGVSNLKLAWVIVQEEDLTDRKGYPDLAALKEHYPELFSKGVIPPKPPADAGKGTREPPKPKQDMNAFIRQASRRH